MWYLVWLLQLLTLFTFFNDFCDKDNKSISTNVLAVHLMFVPGVPASKIVRDDILKKINFLFVICNNSNKTLHLIKNEF